MEKYQKSLTNLPFLTFLKLPINIAKVLFETAIVIAKSTIYTVKQLGNLLLSTTKLVKKEGILQASKIASIGIAKGIKRIGQEIATFGKNVYKLRKTVPIILEKPSKAMREIAADIRKTSEAIPPVDGRIPKGEKVTIKKQLEFTINLFETVKKRFLKIDAEGFSKNLKSWFISTSKRSRLVIVETSNQDPDDLADLIVDSISLDRVLLTGLKADKSEKLLEKLKAKWTQKLSDKAIDNLKAEIEKLKKENRYKYAFPSKRRRSNRKKIKEKSAELAITKKNQADFLELFKSIELFESKGIPWDEAQDAGFDEVIKHCTLKQLMGPHMCQTEIGVDYEKIKKLDDHFHVNIEEVFCYGTANKLSIDAVSLARKIGDNGVPLFALRSENFETCPKDKNGSQIQGAWTAAVKQKKFIKKITEGISTKEIFEKEDDHNMSYKYAQISENFTELFDLDILKEGMNSNHGIVENIDKTRIDLIDSEDIDFFKEIFMDEGLYASATPRGISRTISSAASQLAAKKAEDVASSLKQNAINRPTSSAVEVEFTNGTITLDVGSDMVKERMDKNNSYQLLYNSILAATIEQYPDIDIKKALKIAFSQTLSNYIDIEKKNTIIKELERGRTGAEAWRAFGTESMNEIIKSNDKAINILDKGGYIFGAQTALQAASAINPVAGAVAFGAVGANAVPWSLNTAALTGIAHGIEAQIEAITTHTTNTNTAFSVAGGLKYDAQRERDLQVHTAISVFRKELTSQKSENNNAEEPHLANFNKKQISNPDTKVIDNYSDQQKLIEEEMISEIKQITESEENDTGLVELPEDGIYTLEVQEQHVRKMLDIQARRSKKSSEIQYNKNIVSWMDSASSRARLVIIEPEVSTIENIAETAFNASPLERILITGLDSKEKRDKLKEALRELWKKKLNPRETETNETNGLSRVESNTSSETSEISTTTLEMSNKKAFIDRFKTGDSQTLDEIIDSLELEQLLGPHLCKEDNDISYKSMNSDFEYFDINIEEILLYGKSDELVTNLANLSQKSKNKPASFSVKYGEIKEGDGPWKCEARKPDEFINLVAKGLSAEEIIGLKKTTTNETVTTTYENIKISPIFEKLFDINFIEKISGHLVEHGNHDEGHKISQEDLDYFKKIMFEECLYSADTSPEAIPKTISKSTSILLALASKTIADYLYPNMIGYAYNSILEVIYANVFSTMDAGTDLIKESLDKKNQYKALFEQLLDLAIHHNSSKDEEKPIMEEKVCQSFVETLECYHNNENKNEDIKEVLEGEKGAKKHREASLHYLNKSEAAAQISSTILQVQLPLQMASYGVGIAASVATGAVLAPLLISAAAIGGTSIATKLSAMQILAHANAKLIPMVNQTSGIANAKMYEAKQLRATEIEKTQIAMKDSLSTQKTNPKLVEDIHNTNCQSTSSVPLPQVSKENIEPTHQNIESEERKQKYMRKLQKLNLNEKNKGKNVEKSKKDGKLKHFKLSSGCAKGPKIKSKKVSNVNKGIVS